MRFIHFALLSLLLVWILRACNNTTTAARIGGNIDRNSNSIINSSSSSNSNNIEVDVGRIPNAHSSLLLLPGNDAIAPEHASISVHEAHVIRGLSVTSAILSIIGSILIIFSILIFKDLRRLFTSRLLAYLVISNFFAAVAYLAPLFPSPPNGVLCKLAGSLMTTAELASVFWVCSISNHLMCSVLFPKRRVDRLEILYHCINWPVPLLWTIFLWVKDRFGFAGNWCWLVPDDPLSPFYTSYRFWTFLPIYVAFFFNVIIYVGVMITLRRIFRAGPFSTLFSNTERRRQLRSLFRLSLFIFAFFIVWIPPFTNRLMQTLEPTNNYKLLEYSQAITNPLQGFLNLLIFGLTQRFIYRYKILCCGWAIRRRQQKFLLMDASSSALSTAAMPSSFSSSSSSSFIMLPSLSEMPTPTTTATTSVPTTWGRNKKKSQQQQKQQQGQQRPANKIGGKIIRCFTYCGDSCWNWLCGRDGCCSDIIDDDEFAPLFTGQLEPMDTNKTQQVDGGGAGGKKKKKKKSRKASKREKGSNTKQAPMRHSHAGKLLGDGASRIGDHLSRGEPSSDIGDSLFYTIKSIDGDYNTAVGTTNTTASLLAGGGDVSPGGGGGGGTTSSIANATGGGGVTSSAGIHSNLARTKSFTAYGPQYDYLDTRSNTGETSNKNSNAFINNDYGSASGSIVLDNVSVTDSISSHHHHHHSMVGGRGAGGSEFGGSETGALPLPHPLYINTSAHHQQNARSSDDEDHHVIFMRYDAGSGGTIQVDDYIVDDPLSPRISHGTSNNSNNPDDGAGGENLLGYY